MNITFISQLVKHRELITRLAQREVLIRYRGSVAGWGWTLLNPLMMLGIYTFVFSTIFKARWESSAELGSAGFALNIFAGMIAFGIFAECANKGPSLITSNSNYATKVRFPLDTLACATMLSALFHAITSLIILMVFKLVVSGSWSWSSLLLPAAWTPYLLVTLGFTWLLSAAGVYVRDLGQVMVVATSALTFLSAIFYPVSALPENLVPLFRINIIASWVESTRGILIDGSSPSLLILATSTLAALAFCELSFRLFNKASRGFSDVL